MCRYVYLCYDILLSLLIRPPYESTEHAKKHGVSLDLFLRFHFREILASCKTDVDA